MPGNKIITLTLFFLFFAIKANGQSVGVGTTSPNNTIAILHVKVPNATLQPQGMVLPQLTTAQITSLTSNAVAAGGEADGLVVYDSTTHQIKYFDANADVWRTLDTSSASGVSLWTAISPTQILSTDSVGISTNGGFIPLELFHVDGTARFDSVIITNGAQAGYVLTSDATGNASWQEVTAGGDADSTNELITSFGLTTGNDSLRIIEDGIEFKVPLTSLNSGDADSTNELITSFGLTTGNDSLRIIEDGVEFKIPLTDLGASPWTSDADTVSVTGQRVGIGTTAPQESLHITSGFIRSDSLTGASSTFLIATPQGDIKSSGVSITGDSTEYLRGNGTFGPISGDVTVDSLRTDSVYIGNLTGTAGQVLTSFGPGNSAKWTTISGDNLGNHIATQDLDLSNNGLVNARSLDVDSLNNVQLARIDSINVDSLVVTGGAVGQVLTQSATGTVIWQPAATADDLGNHTATQDLNLGTFGITNASSIEVDSLNSVQVAQIDSLNADTLVVDSVYIGSIGTAGQVLTSQGAGQSAVWQTISSSTPQLIVDSDGDTQIHTETSGDEDTIRFTIRGNESFVFADSGVIHVPNALGSIYIGNNAGIGDKKASNTIIGTGAFQNATAAGNATANTALGQNTLQGITTGQRNTALGAFSLGGSTTGSDNIAIGRSALSSNTLILTGSSNIGIGNNVGTNITSGSENILIGRDAGQNIETGDRNVFIGYRAGRDEPAATNNLLFIENSNSSSPLIWGDFANDSVKINGSFGVSDLAGSTNKLVVANQNGVLDTIPFTGTATDVLLGNGTFGTSPSSSPWSENADSIFSITSNIGIGTTGPTEKLHIASQAVGTNGVRIENYGTGAIPTLTLGASRGTVASPTATNAGDDLGILSFSGYDGTTFGTGSSIHVRSSQVHSPGNHGSRMLFSTVDNNTTTATNRLVLEEDGRVGIGKDYTSVSPAAAFEVGTGTIRISDYTSTNGSIVTIQADGDMDTVHIPNDASQVLLGDGTFGSFTGDNLGDHTATQTINLAGNYISNDGDAEGIQISNSGVLLIDSIDHPSNDNIVMLRDVFVGGSSSRFDNSSEELVIKGRSADWNVGVVNDPLAINSHFFIGLDLNNDDGTFHIHQSGNVGIGTNAPTTKFHIGGNSDANLTANSGLMVIGTVGGVNIVYDENEIQARNNGAVSELNLNADGGVLYIHKNLGPDSTVFIGLDGTVGIGTSTPSAKIEVVGDIVTDSLTTDSIYIGTIGTAGQILTSQGAGKSAVWQDNASLSSLFTDAGTTTHLTSLGDNVGIGTTSADYKLHIQSFSATPEGILIDKVNNTSVAELKLARSKGISGLPTKVLTNDVLGQISFSGFYDGQSEYGQGAVIKALASENHDGATELGNRLVFGTIPVGSNAPQDRMTISENGNIGIGVATPDAKLHVDGDVTLGNSTATNETAVTVYLINNTGIASSKGDIVIVDPAADNSFTFTTSAGHASVVGVVYETGVADGSFCKVAISGVVKVRANTAAIIRGQHCITGITDGQAGSVAIPTAGTSIGIWLENVTIVGGLGNVLLR